MNTLKKRKEEVKWFAVYTRPKTEKKVEERLSAAGFDTFLPLQTVEKKWSDRKKRMKVPLINSYVFVKSTCKNLGQIYSIPGVINILKYLGNYAVVKDSEIENLRILSTNSHFKTTIRSIPVHVVKGAKVTVAEGPFKGLYGVYQDKAGKNKVIIVMETLGSCVEVTLPLKCLQTV
ncbi:UpxY family transcription antiterminator [Polaribacter sp. L3A8]|uniref:UpxY family transcription antiterminator n=1 Tax=Polaribacter sp. L3A8 TaxID=2686361 RepID=UPI00131A9130|nr:UpxY family transcription antiterminator [Polaribacter sp. L3A8]